MTQAVRNAVAAAALCFITPAVAQAQETQQARIVGPSGNAEYPLLVEGANGVSYVCRDTTRQGAGRIERLCRRSASIGSTSGGTGLGLGGSMALPLGLLAIVGFAAASDSN